jgi:hypothetical protein
MPLAKAISRSEVEQRSKETLVDPALIEKIAGRVGITDQAAKQKLTYTIQAYRARVLALQQESPARIVAALKPGLNPARKLLEWLKLLPDGLLIELQAGGLEEHLHRIINRANYWQRHVEAHRQAGEGDASLDLRLSLLDIVAAHCPDAPEWKRRRRVAFACREIGARYPNEKKHRRRFTGEQKRPSKPGPKLYLRPLRKSAAERRLQRRLKDVPI